MQRYSQNASMLPDQNGAYVSAKDAEELQRRLNKAILTISLAAATLEKSMPEGLARTTHYESLRACRICLDENKIANNAVAEDIARHSILPHWQPAEAEPKDNEKLVAEIGSYPIRQSTATGLEPSTITQLIKLGDPVPNVEPLTEEYKSSLLEPKCPIKQAFKEGGAPDICPKCGVGPCKDWPIKAVATPIEYPGCNEHVKSMGLAIPRTCPSCGLGPCKEGR